MASDPGKDAIALHINRSPGQHLAWADSDRVLALPLSDSGLILLDPQSPNAEPVWLGPRDKQAWSVAAMNASRSLLVSYVDGTVIVWDLASKQPIGSPLSNPQAAPTSRIGIGSLSISPDQRLLAASGGDRVVTIYDLGTHSVSQALQTQSSDGTQTVAFSPDGRKLAALGNDNRLYVWTIGQPAPNLISMSASCRAAPLSAMPLMAAATRVGSAGWTTTALPSLPALPQSASLPSIPLNGSSASTVLPLAHKRHYTDHLAVAR